jgi:hypothetical protein
MVDLSLKQYLQQRGLDPSRGVRQIAPNQTIHLKDLLTKSKDDVEPSTTQLKRIGQALEEAIRGTVTGLPIGDKGSITADTVQYNPANNTIHFHVTIHYKQTGFLTVPLYDFKTFYEGDINPRDVQGSIEQTRYSFDLPNIPGFGPTRVSLSVSQLVALAKIIAEILA